MARGFDGTNDYLRQSSVNLTVTDNYTLAAYIYIAALPTTGSFDMVMYNGVDGSGGQPTDNGYGFGVGGDNGATGSKLIGLHGGIAWRNTSYTFGAAATWYHVVMRRSSGTLTFWVDGADTGYSATDGAPNTPNTDFTIGAQNREDEGIIWRFNGRIAEVALWNRAVSNAEIAGLGGDKFSPAFFPRSLVAYYPLIGRKSPETSLKGQTAALTGAPSTQPHPRIIYPYGFPLAVPRPINSIQFDMKSNSGYNTADAVYSWSHVCSGSDRILVVTVSMLSVAGSSVSGITYNSVALTKVRHDASVSGAVRTEIWYLVAPTTGSNTVEVTLSAALDSIATAQSYTGVDQVSPIDAQNGATATNVGAADATVDVTTVSDKAWVVDAVASTDTAITVGTNQRQRANVTGAAGSGGSSDEGYKSPAGAVTMNWTNVAALATWTISAISLKSLPSTVVAGTLRSWRQLMGIGF